MSLEWQDIYRVGHTDIDSQHQGMFRLTSTLIAASTREGRIMCAKRLYDHTRDHFVHEESLMRSLHYPEIDDHIAEHQALVLKLEAITQELARGTLQPGELERFITDWLVIHMTTLDAKLSIYLRS